MDDHRVSSCSDAEAVQYQGVGSQPFSKHFTMVQESTRFPFRNSLQGRLINEGGVMESRGVDKGGEGLRMKSKPLGSEGRHRMGDRGDFAYSTRPAAR